MKHTHPFSFSPNIINLLGNELIQEKKIAIAELVKNAYDADAQNAYVEIVDNKITILDDGQGMDINTVRNYWLNPGSSEKRDNPKRSPKYSRLPLGEKGVGRLGVHHLGRIVEIISKMKNSKEVQFKIDWDSFNNKEKMEDVEPVTITENDIPKEFDDLRTGTKIIITDLRETFDQDDLEKLNNDLFKLLSPFHNFEDRFIVNLYNAAGKFKSKKSLSLDNIKDNALFHFGITFEKGEITDFKYKFIPPSHDKIKHRELQLRDIKGDTKSFFHKAMKKPEYSNFIEGAKNKNFKDIGTVTFRGYVFEPKLTKDIIGNFDREITKYLDKNGGIRVYRDGVRIYNYGEGRKNNDILDLDAKRIKKLGEHIGYNQILATIELEREKSMELKEKTNREGFIHNDAFLYLQEGLDFCLSTFNYYRQQDRALVKELVGKEYDKGYIGNKLAIIVKDVESLSIDESKKEILKRKINDFNEQFEDIKEIFLAASNTGLNLSFLVHEVDKIIYHLEKEINSGDIIIIKKVFNYLKETISMYKDVIKISKKKSIYKVKNIIEQAMFSANYRFESHGIKIHREIEEDLEINCKKNFIVGAINNLFDNSIYWLDFYEIEKKEIFIKGYKQGKHVYLIIADNGKGFNIDFDAAIRPFISGKFDDSSMGIGLHLTDQIMNANNGELILGDYKQENLPKQFSIGAILKLKFNIEK